MYLLITDDERVVSTHQTIKGARDAAAGLPEWSIWSKGEWNRGDGMPCARSPWRTSF